MKQRRRTEWAARLVQRAYRGWKRRRFLLRLAHHLPSESPLSREWPRAPLPCQHTSALLYKLYHKWRGRETSGARDAGTSVGSVNELVFEGKERRVYLLNRCWKISMCHVLLYFQCHKYRMRFDQTSRNRMREKVTSSIIFKGRKASYSKR